MGLACRCRWPEVQTILGIITLIEAKRIQTFVLGPYCAWGNCHAQKEGVGVVICVKPEMDSTKKGGLNRIGEKIDRVN